MKLSRSWAAGGAGLAAALAWWAGSWAGGGVAPVAAGPGLEPPSSPPAAATAQAVVSVAQASAVPAAAQSAQPGLAMVPITLTAPATLQVGEQAELVVAVGANAAVGELGFTIRFDPNVLQVRAGTPGEWATGDGHGTRFTVEVAEAADQVQIRSAPAGTRAGAAGGAVALVQFQAVGPGTTAVAMTDMTATDQSGRSMPILLSMPKVQVTAEDAPPPQGHESQPR